VTTLFWISLAIILYTYAGYPLVMAALARAYPRPWRRAPWPAGSAPISVIMAVHNGAALLPAKLDHLLALDPTLVGEILVVCDGSTDSTPAILSQATKKRCDPRLKAIQLPRQEGKSAALNYAITAASGEILLFVDLRPLIQPGALASLLQNFSDPKIGCVAGELLLETEGHDATATAVSGLYWKYEQWIRNCETAWDSPVGVYGGFYAIRRALATPVPPGTILDDMFQPLSIIRQGYRSVVDRTAFVVDRWPAKTSGEFSRKVRTLAGNFQLLRIAPWLLTPANRVLLQLVSHKLLRLVVPWCFLGLLVSSVVLSRHSPGMEIFAILQVVGWMLALLSLRVKVSVLGRIAAPAGALLVLNAAAIAGFYTFLFTRGPLWKIWNPTPAEPRRVA
jgi:cellulose synthase/poly-beta-1,6-N-acetylglucosamine synthase-like glycosyltransferase